MEKGTGSIAKPQLTRNEGALLGLPEEMSLPRKARQETVGQDLAT